MSSLGEVERSPEEREAAARSQQQRLVEQSWAEIGGEPLCISQEAQIYTSRYLLELLCKPNALRRRP